MKSLSDARARARAHAANFVSWMLSSLCMAVRRADAPRTGAGAVWGPPKL